MAYEESLIISGVTSTGLVAGPEAAGGSAQNIYIRKSGGVAGELNDGVILGEGSMYVSNGGVANSTAVSSGGSMTVYSGGVANSTTVSSGGLQQVLSGGMVNSTTINGIMRIFDDGSAEGTVIENGGTMYVYSGGSAKYTSLRGNRLFVSGGLTESTTIFGGRMSAYAGAMASATYLSGGYLSAYNSGTVKDTTIAQDGLLTIVNGGVANLTAVSSGGSMYISNSGVANLTTISSGGSMNVSNGGLVNSTTVSGIMRVSAGGSAEGTVIENTASMYVYSSGSAKYTTLRGNRLYVSGGLTESTTILGGRMSAYAGGVASATFVSKGFLHVANSGTAKDTTVAIGGSMSMDGGVTEGMLTFDLTGATKNTTALINDLTRVNAETTTLSAKISAWSTNDYVIATTGDTTKSITVTDGSATATLANGDAITNPFAGASYTWDGRVLDGAAYSFTATATAAGALSTETAASINGGDLAVKWTSATAFTSGNVFLAGATTNGKTAWVELDGYEGGTGTTLYGAQGNTFSEGTVNIDAKSGSLRNLAAGANAGGTVKAVNLFFAGAELDGTGYAGGFGNVTGKTATTITTGTFAKDFYAGALANKLTTTTSVGDVSMTVAGGTFDGNIFGASAVKTDSTKGTGTRHTAGNVTLTVTGGSTTKGDEACIFAGGYATGNATGTVYTVDSVTVTISGGSWGEAAGGRGVFGGVFASGVEAQVLGNVNITISGDATMGNVYGGGWAQKTGAKSIVGDVNINIEGGTIANVFGGGSHSTSGGTTETGDVTITVSGGNITGDIYARGQLDGDITGVASVIFTGSDGFDCGVYGYSYVGGEAGDANLSYTGYTGEFSGKIGGFDGIKFDGGTAMTLTAIADDVSNGAWEFDLTDRASTLAGTSLLTWDEGSFENDSIKVSFADDTQAQGGWNIVTDVGTFSGTTFCVEIGGTEIASGLNYSQQIASGDYAGWGFELESGVLKFKQLA